MLIRPALLIHEFARLDQTGDDGSGVPDRLRALWNRGFLDKQVGPPDADVATIRVPPGTSARGFDVLATRRGRHDDDRVYEAVLSAASDSMCLTVLLAPNLETSTWADLDAQWPHGTTAEPGAGAAAEPHAGAGAEPGTGAGGDLGTLRIYVAYVESPLDEETVGRIAAAIGGAVPDPGGATAWTRDWSRTAQDFLLWEPPARHPGERRLILIGQESAEDELDAFAWTSGGRVLGPLVYYLLDSEKLRYELAVHNADFPRIRQLCLDIDGAVDRLLALHRSASTAPADLVRADDALTQLQTDATGMITTLARLRKVAWTVGVAKANMTAAVPALPSARGPLAADQAMAKVLSERIGDDIAYLDISRERADRVSALTATAVQRGLGAFQQQLLLVQTSVVGAIVMILAAVQAFETKVDIPALLQAPLIAVLGSLALALPTAATRWSSNISRDMPLRTVDYLATFALGASLGWLVGEVVSYAIDGHPLDKLPTWLLSLVVGLAATALARLRSRQLDRPAGTDPPP
ncbi:CATRA conflict system CASPASE/TPR repeat-associated protein [Plantactinospora solaniradicis]|uniref:CATRA conflict system CASPASE/TPR repeat-associated protein n=1 Tax=Plantactinospora solaniradicis TaxID=1723736 RepID=A0ABW1KE70_9ACTN